MKVKKVSANNRKKVFEIITTRGRFELPYSQVEPTPSAKNPIRDVYPDPELAYDGFTYFLESGEEGAVVMDQVLEYNKDPDYVRKMLLLELTVKAQERIKESGISKREIIRRMGTTPTQFYRLVDHSNMSKTIDQMVKLLSALNCHVNLVVKTAA